MAYNEGTPAFIRDSGAESPTTIVAGYKNILLGIDLSPDSDALLRRTAELAADFEAALTLLHVVEYVPVEPMGEALLPTAPITEELSDASAMQLEQLAGRCGLGDAPRIVRVGNTKAEIVEVAREIGADLIVLGSHERHGLAILVNRTDDTVLHAAPCDVLAVRLG